MPSDDLASLRALATVVRHEAGELVLRVDPERLTTVVADALARLPVRDLTVEDAPIEEVIAELFAGQAKARLEAAP